MKALISTLIATIASVSTVQAHCGSCSTDEMHGEDHASCYAGTMDAYFSIQKALASDDLSAAKSSATKLEEGLANSECSMDGGDCCAEVSGSASAIASAVDISAARTAFHDFSKTLLAQVESHNPEQPVYEMYCPMAFNNKGGTWLQDSKDLRNPYFGSSMLTCGTTKATFGKNGEMKGKMEHGAHNH